jgi:hypothetical protein
MADRTKPYQTPARIPVFPFAIFTISTQRLYCQQPAGWGTPSSHGESHRFQSYSAHHLHQGPVTKRTDYGPTISQSQQSWPNGLSRKTGCQHTPVPFLHDLRINNFSSPIMRSLHTVILCALVGRSHFFSDIGNLPARTRGSSRIPTVPRSDGSDLQ